MNQLVAALSATLLSFTAACARDGGPTRDQPTVPSERTLVGQLLLPGGLGSRGVEVLLKVTGSGSDPYTVWVLFDEQGRFAHTLQEDLVSVQVTAGIGAEVHRIEGSELPEVNQAGQIDVGVIDLRDRLAKHRMVLRAAEGKPQGEVRVGMWCGLPPGGPHGESVALGSRQFPPVVLGSEVEWLLAHDARDIYFLVERPDGPGRGMEWRSGYQRLFGPFTSAEIPSELVMN